MSIQLSEMSIPELEELIKNAQAEIQSKKGRAAAEFRATVEKLAREQGLDFNSMYQAVGEKRPEKQSAKQSSKSASVPQFRHPDNPQLTWRGGKGPIPEWVKQEMMERNITKEQLKEDARYANPDWKGASR